MDAERLSDKMYIEFDRSQFEKAKSKDWDMLKDAIRELRSYERAEVATEIREVAKEIFIQLSDERNPGKLETMRREFDVSLGVLVTTLTMPDEISVPSNSFFHVVRHLDLESREDIAFELYISDHPFYEPTRTHIPRSQDPNISKDGKLAGLYVGEGANEMFSRVDLAQLVESHQTLAAFCEIGDVALPESYHAVTWQ